MSNSKLYVGNLPYSMRDDDLQQHFARFGDVASAKVMMDRDTGRSKGFGFVEMGSADDAKAAMQRHERPIVRRPRPGRQRSPITDCP